MKTCKACNTEKPLSEFGPHKSTADKHATNCRPCDSKRQVAHQKKNAEKYKAQWVRRGILRHNITLEKYQELLDSHDGGCWICGATSEDKRLAIDHDHSCCPGAYSCGKCVRGLLCHPCNLSIGHFDKNGIDFTLVSKYLRV